MEVYVDGVSAWNQTIASRKLDDTNEFGILGTAGDATCGLEFDGSIDDFIISTDAWSAAEVSTDWNNGRVPYDCDSDSDVVVCLHFDEESGNSVNDDSPNNNDGTINSGAFLTTNRQHINGW